jgi:hypothetical protein
VYGCDFSGTAVSIVKVFTGEEEEGKWRRWKRSEKMGKRGKKRKKRRKKRGRPYSMASNSVFAPVVLALLPSSFFLLSF